MKKILPRILALILCAAFLGVPAYAAGESEETAGSLGPVMIWGTLTHMDDGGLLVANSQEGAAYSEVVLHGATNYLHPSISSHNANNKNEQSYE